MKVIRIDRKSIRRNPNAGSTETYVFGAKEATFSIQSDVIPQWLHEEPFIPCNWSYDDGVLVSMDGVVNMPIEFELVEKCQMVTGLNIIIKQSPQVIRHMPEPAFYYDYVSTLLKCKHCKNLVPHDEIQQDYDMDGHEMDVCPVCDTYNTFTQRRYETIDSVINSIYFDIPDAE